MNSIHPDLDEAALAAGRARFEAVRERIERAAARVDRDPAEITLVGVAKKQPIERVLAAIAAGVHVLGQSYIQEAREMRPLIEEALARSDVPAAGSTGRALEWRMVGRLQRNKAGLAARLFDAVESVDRPELAQTLSRRAESEGRMLSVLVQVSLAGETQKGGCPPEDVPALLAAIDREASLRFDGFMTVPPASPEAESARPIFAALRRMRTEVARTKDDGRPLDLSMGMSGDLEVAVEEGATLVRVGTALFGPRAS